MTRPLRSRSITLPLLVGSLSLSATLLWFLITPPFEAPDENLHYDFISFLATVRTLPDANAATRAGWDAHEWIQPPLYYALIASVVALRGPDRDINGLVLVNPNNTIHNGVSTRTFTWDRRRTRSTDTYFYARAASSLMGVLTVLFIYAAATRVLASEQAALTAAVVALIPQYGHLTAAVSNDTLASLFSAATVALLLVMWKIPRLPLAIAVVTGLAAGAAIVSKIHTVFLLPTIALAVLLRARGQWIRAVTFLALVGLGACASAGWYFVRNTIVFGDPLASGFKLGLIADVVKPSRLSLLDPYFYTAFPTTLFRSFWASFGWLANNPSDVLMTGYAVISGLLSGVVAAYLVALPRRGRIGRPEQATAIVVAIASAIGGLAGSWMPGRSVESMLPGFAVVAGVCVAVSVISLVLLIPEWPIERHEREIAVTLSASVAILFGELVIYNITWPYTNQGRYLYPALAPIAIVSALALRHAGVRLPQSGLRQWALPAFILIVAAVWTLAFRSGFAGFHVAL